jgi:hypothetical protein
MIYIARQQKEITNPLYFKFHNYHTFHLYYQNYEIFLMEQIIFVTWGTSYWICAVLPLDYGYWPSVRCDRLNNSTDRSRSWEVNCPSLTHKIVSFSETVQNCPSPSLHSARWIAMPLHYDTSVFTFKIYLEHPAQAFNFFFGPYAVYFNERTSVRCQFSYSTQHHTRGVTATLQQI